MKRKSVDGIGLSLLNNRIMNKGWRPVLPKYCYPSLRELIKDCWQDDAEARPDFTAVVERLGGAVAREVESMEEVYVRSVEEEWVDFKKGGGVERRGGRRRVGGANK